MTTVSSFSSVSGAWQWVWWWGRLVALTMAVVSVTGCSLAMWYYSTLVNQADHAKAQQGVWQQQQHLAVSWNNNDNNDDNKEEMGGNSSRRRTTTMLVPVPQQTIRNSPQEQDQQDQQQPLVPELMLDLVPTARLLVM